MDHKSESDHGSDKVERKRIDVENVVDAIKALKEVNGCTVTAVKKYIASNSSNGLRRMDASRQINQALKRGLKAGQISKVNGYKYAVGVKDEDGSKKKRRRRVDDDDDGGRPNRRRRSRRRRGSRGRKGRRRSRRRRRSRKRRGRRRSRRRRGGKKSRKRGGRRRRSRRRRRRR